MIIIGFMVIFRMKIDPKTVITVQAAIPRIVITLLLITLSYPIVGFFVDLMYLTMSIVINLMVSAAGGQIAGANLTNLQSKYLTSTLGDLFGAVYWPSLSILWKFRDVFLGSLLASPAIYFLIIPGTVLAPYIAGAAAALPIVIIVIILLGLLFTFIRLALLLLNSYIQLLISLILGPIFLLMEAIPGRNAFSEWILNIIANLVVFPATAMIILFAVFLSSTQAAGSVSWSPPFIGISGASGNLFNTFLGLGVIFLAPTLVAQIKKQFHPKPVLPISAGTVFAPATGGVQTLMGAGSSYYYMQYMPLVGRFFRGGGQQPGHPPPGRS